MYARLYDQKYPGEFVGMVQVDAAHEDLNVRPLESLVKMGKRGQQLMSCGFRFFQLLNSIGLLALFPDRVSRMWFGPIPEKAREASVGVACSSTRGFEARRQEVTIAWANLAEARSAQLTTLGDMPLVVLTWGRGGTTAGAGVSAEDTERHSEVEAEMQGELVALSTRGKQIIAEESGHYIQVDQPELVVNATREVVEAAQEQSRAK